MFKCSNINIGLLCIGRGLAPMIHAAKVNPSRHAAFPCHEQGRVIFLLICRFTSFVCLSSGMFFCNTLSVSHAWHSPLANLTLWSSAALINSKRAFYSCTHAYMSVCLWQLYMSTFIVKCRYVRLHNAELLCVFVLLSSAGSSRVGPFQIRLEGHGDKQY